MTLGIIPAGGAAIRMMGIAKMLLPTPEGILIDVLRQRMRLANPRLITIMATNGMARQLENYTAHDTRVIDGFSLTMSEAVLRAREYAEPDETVLFGMPDTYFEDVHIFERLEWINHADVDVLVGTFYPRPEQRHKLGMCRIESGDVVEVVDKPEQTTLTHAWGTLSWKPAFWEFIRPQDPHVGYALPCAIAAGLKVYACMMDGQYFDCGTPDEYFALIRHLTGGVHEPL